MSFTPGQVISVPDPLSFVPGFSTVSVRLSSLKAPSAALRAAGGGFWVDGRTGTMEKQARGKGTRVRDANILTRRTALSTPITGPGKSRRSGPDGFHNSLGGGNGLCDIYWDEARDDELNRRALKQARVDYYPHSA